MGLQRGVGWGVGGWSSATANTSFRITWLGFFRQMPLACRIVVWLVSLLAWSHWYFLYSYKHRLKIDWYLKQDLICRHEYKVKVRITQTGDAGLVPGGLSVSLLLCLWHQTWEGFAARPVLSSHLPLQAGARAGGWGLYHIVQGAQAPTAGLSDSFLDKKLGVHEAAKFSLSLS